MEENLSPELKDILEMIRRYSVSHNQGCFMFSFVGFKKDQESVCEECGDFCDCVDDSKSRIGAYGDIETLRIMCNEMRDMIEDEVDEDGYINV
jgi:hypothetical protein